VQELGLNQIKLQISYNRKAKEQLQKLCIYK